MRELAPIAYREDTWEAFKILNDIEQRVFVLHIVEGRTQAEVASIIGRSKAVVTKNTYRALRRMDNFLKGKHYLPNRKSTHDGRLSVN